MALSKGPSPLSNSGGKLSVDALKPSSLGSIGSGRSSAARAWSQSSWEACDSGAAALALDWLRSLTLLACRASSKASRDTPSNLGPRGRAPSAARRSFGFQ
ncbi:MAG: hypothetical protein AB8B36_13940 [Prochlorococcus sp.]